MCGRYAASANQAMLVDTFEVDEVVEADRPAPWVLPRFNIAPTDPVATVFERAAKDSGEVVRKLGGLRWGLVPSWSKGPSGRAPLINARLETVDSKPSFRKPFATRRCLIPADGYYEWYALTEPDGSPVLGKGRRAVKQPFYISPRSGPMTMAGLYDYWRDPDKDREDPEAWVVSCCIITTTASDDLGRIHDRMPVQVLPEHQDAWLDPGMRAADTALGLVHVPEPGEMVAWAVSTAVNSVRNDGPELIEPLPLDEQHEVDAQTRDEPGSDQPGSDQPNSDQPTLLD